jgi:hypothetical protein
MRVNVTTDATATYVIFEIGGFKNPGSTSQVNDNRVDSYTETGAHSEQGTNIVLQGFQPDALTGMNTCS